MRSHYKQQSLMAEINITPFTDVILVLLIIFMIATPIISQNAIEVKVPKAASQDTVEDPKSVYVTITSEGIVYFDDKIVTTKELKQQISSLLNSNSNLETVVAADQACRFQEVVKVMDVLKELGVKRLSIATKPGD